jgi:hypothetical protein
MSSIIKSSRSHLACIVMCYATSILAMSCGSGALKSRAEINGKFMNPGGANSSSSDGFIDEKNCDVEKVKALTTSHCVICHGNGNSFGNFTVDNAADWTVKSPELTRVLSVTVIKPSMPPPGSAAIAKQDFETLKKCIAKGRENSGASSLFYEPGAEVANKSKFIFRRLSKAEYLNSIAAVFGQDIVTAINTRVLTLPGDSKDKLFSTVTKTAGRNHVEAYSEIALEAANAIVQSKFSTFAPCMQAAGTEPPSNACIQSVVSSLSKTVYRRSATNDEIKDANAAYQYGASTRDSREGVRTLLMYLLQGTPFLYQIDAIDTTRPAPSGSLQLANSALANRLSFALTKAPPDAVLVASAESGRLQAPDERRAQAARLLDSSAGKAAFREFIDQLVGLDSMSPLPTDSNFLSGQNTHLLKEGMMDDVRSLAERVLFRNGSYSNLLLDSDARVNPSLAQIYNVPFSGDELIRLDSNRYAGLLTRPGVTARGQLSAPYHLAENIRRNFIDCKPLSLPTSVALPAANPADPKTDVTLTTRQRFEKATSAPQCVSCHFKMNFVFALGNYDSIGRWRDTENIRNPSGHASQASIDTLTQLYFDGVGSKKDVSGPVDLSRALAESRQSAQCFYLRWATYAFGRNLTKAEHSWILQEPAAGSSSGINQEAIKERILKIVSSEAFTKASVSP